MVRIVGLAAGVIVAFAVASPFAQPQAPSAPAADTQVASVNTAQGQPAAQANVSGAWDIVISVPDAPLSLYAEWTQKDGAVNGSVFDAQEEMKVSGTMEGNMFRMNLYVSGVVIRLAGELKGDTLSGKAGHASAGQVDWSATRAKAQ